MNPAPLSGGLSVLRPAGDKARARRDAGQAVAAAAGQIDLALREAEAPAQRLGESLAATVEGMAALRESLANADSPHAADPAEIAAGLQRQFAAAVEHAQCFDRLFQHLSHLRDFLAGAAGHLEAISPVAADDNDWNALCARFRARLLTAEQRALLDRTLPPPPNASLDDAAARGSIELF
jgi:hypothetical protein